MLDKIRAIIIEQTGREDSARETRIEELGIDSLEFVMLMQEICLKFWDIPDERWAHIHTLGDIETELIAAKP